MTKNKIKALLLAICIALPSMFAFTACGHKHEYSDDWSYDATNHWHACTGKECDETKDSAKHTITYNKTETTHQAECSVCGYKGEVVEHTFVAKHNETQYWQECSVCGKQQEKVTGTVSETEWQNALNFEGVTNFHSINYSNYTIKEVKVSETAASSVMTTAGTGSLRDKKIYVVEGTGVSEAVYKYTYNKKNESDLSKDVWKKESTSINKSELKDVVNPTNELSTAAKTITSFEYDAETGTYVSKADAIDLKYSSSNLLSCKFKFANAKLVWFEYTLDMQNIQPEYCVISYGDTEAETPDLAVISAEDWEKSLSFDGLDNYTMNLDLKGSTEKISVTSTKVKYEKTTKADNKTSINIFDVENHQKYEKADSATKYTRTENGLPLDSLLQMSFVGCPNLYVRNFINAFESFEYKADEHVYYLQQATILGSTVQDVKLTFNNRRLVKLEYDTTSGGRTTNTITYAYNDTTVTLPVASETETKVLWSSLSNKFDYNGISLASGENVFVIEIEDSKHDGQKVQGGDTYILNGSFTLTDGTSTKLTITAKNSSSSDVANSAKTGIDSTNGAMTFKNLTAGKYYITISAESACTGNFNLLFLTRDVSVS